MLCTYLELLMRISMLSTCNVSAMRITSNIFFVLESQSFYSGGNGDAGSHSGATADAQAS